MIGHVSISVKRTGVFLSRNLDAPLRLIRYIQSYCVYGLKPCNICVGACVVYESKPTAALLPWPDLLGHVAFDSKVSSPEYLLGRVSHVCPAQIGMWFLF